MKKSILFTATIFSISSLAAQENKLFDVQEYLKKKKQPSGVLPENPLLLPKTNFVLPQATLSHTLANGNKVYILPQDNMPCVVPDMDLQGEMPNVLRVTVDGVMPNVGRSILPLIPGKKK